MCNALKPHLPIHNHVPIDLSMISLRFFTSSVQSSDSTSTPVYIIPIHSIPCLPFTLLHFQALIINIVVTPPFHLQFVLPVLSNSDTHTHTHFHLPVVTSQVKLSLMRLYHHLLLYLSSRLHFEACVWGWCT